MNTILVFDTETTGFPNTHKPSVDPGQPHLVQLGAILVNADTRDVIASMDVIVKPDGWEIPQKCTDVHGISTAYALGVGVPESTALRMFLALQAGATRLAHNSKFDERIIDIARVRYASEYYLDPNMTCCTLEMSRKRKGGSHKLADVLKELTGRNLVGAHSALPDAQACLDIYFAMLDADKPKPMLPPMAPPQKD